MSGPYINGLGCRRKRKWREETSSSEHENEDFFSSDEDNSHSRKRRRVTTADAELVPKFYPDDASSNITGWLHKIDQLGNIYGWKSTDRQFIMQLRLRGAARSWYEDLEDYNLTWAEWKETIMTAFPRSTDYVDRLELMLARVKQESETMTKFYHAKLSLLKKCNIDGKNAISCIIRGLPAELRANAKAYNCETPENLYYGYLSSLENYKQVEAARTSTDKGKSTWKRGNTNAASAPVTSQSLLPKICYQCRRPGHEARDCRMLQRCESCHRTGHTSATCWFRAGNSQLQTRQVGNVWAITYDIYHDLYRRQVLVDGHQLSAYIDTGSKLNILTLAAADELQLEIKPSSVIMKAFGGSCTHSLGTTEIIAVIDNLQLRGNVEVTDCDLPNIDLIMGQPMINQNNVSLLTTDTSVNFLPTHIVSPLLCDIQLNSVDFVSKYPVCLKCDVIIPKRSSIYVEVVVDCADEGEHTFLTHPVCFELGRTSYFISETVICTNKSYLQIVNLGSEDIMWAKNRLIARADRLTQQTHDCGVEVFSVYDSSTVDDGRNGIDISEVDMGDISEANKTKLLKLLDKYDTSFAKDTKDLGCTDLIKMRIQTTSNQPVYCKPYRLSHKESEIVNEKVQDLLNAGIVRESMSEYASPVVLVRKKGGDYRLCVDYRALNARTVKDRYPLPHIEDQVTRLAGKTFFTTLDLAQGYYQVPIEEESICKTAFVTPSGQFEFLKMPFGLANAPAVFSRLIQMTLGRVSRDIALYLDDVMIPTTTVEEGLDLLEKVLQLLTDAKLKLNLKKCSFLKNTATYLGHEITAGTIQPGQAKLNCVANYSRPRNVHEIRQFIGLTSYFRKFIQGFAQIARPLTELTRKDVEWSWGVEQENAFQTLKRRLIEKPVLAIYDKDAKTELHTDASKLGLGGILMQYQRDNSLKPIAYFSRVTTKEESFYHSYELETLAVVESLKRFRIYLIGIPIRVVTDCSALRTTLTKKDLIPRIARWWLTIQDFDLDIEYRAGERMKHVDALSRNPVSNHVLIIDNSDWLMTLQMQDDNIQSILTQLRSGDINPDISENYIDKEGILYRKTLAGDRFVIPKLAKYGLLQKLHDQIGHPGFDKCEQAIKAQFWFPKMTRFIRKYINSCLQCAFGKGNYGRVEGELHPIEKQAIPMHTLHADHLGPFVKTRKGHTYVLVIIDSFTKFVFAKATKSCSSIETIRLLKEVFTLFGNPVRIITDRGKAFTSRYFKQFAQEAQFKHVLNAIASPRSNGQVERVNRTLLNGLNTMTQSECTWDNKLADVVWGINNTPNATTGESPFSLMFGHSNSRFPAIPTGEPHDSETMQQQLQQRRNQAKLRIDRNMTLMKSRFDAKHKKCQKYNVGQLVLWKGGVARDPRAKITRKLDGLYTGPYRVCKAEHSLDRYTISSVKGMKGYRKFSAVVRGETLRPYKTVMSGDDDTSGSDHEVDRDDLVDLLES